MRLILRGSQISTLFGVGLTFLLLAPHLQARPGNVSVNFVNGVWRVVGNAGDKRVQIYRASSGKLRTEGIPSHARIQSPGEGPRSPPAERLIPRLD